MSCCTCHVAARKHDTELSKSFELQTYEETSAEVARAEYAVQLSTKMLQDLQARLATPAPSDFATPSPQSTASALGTAAPQSAGLAFCWLMYTPFPLTTCSKLVHAP